MKMMTVKEVAAIAGVSVLTLRRWIRAGSGPPYHLTPTRKYRLEEADVMGWLNSLRHQPSVKKPDASATD